MLFCYFVKLKQVGVEGFVDEGVGLFVFLARDVLEADFGVCQKQLLHLRDKGLEGWFFNFPVAKGLLDDKFGIEITKKLGGFVFKS